MQSDDGPSLYGPLKSYVVNSGLKRSEFLSAKMPTAHVTEIGFCVHDWSMLPCQRHLDCINCRSHVCVKGDTEKTERIRTMLQQTRELVAEAEKAQAREYTGANRWLDHQRQTLERLVSLLRVFDDPNVPEGSVITLSVREEFSPIHIAIDDRIRSGDAKLKDLLQHVSTFKPIPEAVGRT